MTISEKYSVRSIDSFQCKEWLLYKHYAKRIPAIIYSFGLYDSNLILQGCCTFGCPARMLNNGYGIFDGKLSINTVELNRLVVNDGLEKNILSFFVTECLSFLPKPIVVVSYADGNNGHHGYIYQATNFIYTGITAMEKMYFNKNTGKIIHPRTIVSTYGSREVESLPDHIEISKEDSGKYRYLRFLGSKTIRQQMIKNLKYPILEYPKGTNDRYDAGYNPTVQTQLF